MEKILSVSVILMSAADLFAGRGIMTGYCESYAMHELVFCLVMDFPVAEKDS